jgi:uncharacterized protein (DUF3820 family)
MTLGWLLRSKTNRHSYKVLSDIDKVKYLEKRRQYKAYDKGWLYHRCREKDLLEAYLKLFRADTKKHDTGTKFSFGKYRGELIEEIWESDKNYIQWLSKQDWIAEYSDESDMIHELLHLEDEGQY